MSHHNPKIELAWNFSLLLSFLKERRVLCPLSFKKAGRAAGGCLAGLLMLGGLCSCRSDLLPYAHDIQGVELMQVIGVDKGESQPLKVTMTTGKRRTGGSGDAKPPILLDQEGETLYQCALAIQTKGDSYITYTHAINCLLSEELAKEGVEYLTDFLQRDTEMRMNTDLYIVKEGKVSDLMEKSNGEDKALVDRLEAMVLDADTDSDTYIYTLKDLVVMLEENGCGLAAALKMGEKEAEAAGFACFKDGKLVGYLEEEKAVGVNLLENHVYGGDATVHLSDGSIAALRLKETDCKWSPVFDGEKLTGMKAQISVHAGLEELWGEADPESEEVLRELGGKLEEQMKSAVTEVLDQCKSWNADILHLETSAALAKPWKKAAIEAQWEAVFPRLDFQVEVTGVIDQTYDIAKPLGRSDK